MGGSYVFFQVIVEDAQPGCSFVLGNGELDGKIRDFRLYVVQEMRGLGYGFLVASFVKAYLFPWVSDHHAPRAGFVLPLGGARGLKNIQLLPVTQESKTFYRKQGFERAPTSQNFIWAPACGGPRLSDLEREKVFGLPARPLLIN